ncbi:MAG: PQQ-dependent sugar dehydrogenase [Bacteroidota bacterium]
MKKRLLVLTNLAFPICSAILVLQLALGGQLSAQTFPAGFSRVQVTATGSTVTGMTFAPDGRIFIAHQDGRIRLYKNGVLSTMLTLSGVRNGGEDGLSAITVDPNFATNNYIYICYTTTSLVNRLARLTLSGDAVVAQLTLRDFPLLSTTSQRHNGGAIRFKGGYLYITIGENDVISAAQSKTSYGGKVLRLNADGTPAVGNPYYNEAGASTITKCIWSLGERNPWSLDISPSTGKIYVCNVGQYTSEEINDVTTAGTNSGHPTVEGNSTNPAFKNPVFSIYNPPNPPANTGEGCAIIGGAFLESPATNYPATYVGKFFYMDYCNNFINYVNPSTGANTNFATGVGAASPNASSTTLRLGVDGNIYYAQGGTIFKVIYTNTSTPAITNQPLSVTVTAGQPASFSVNASGATPMTFQWKKSGVNITGATSSTYTIPNVTTANAGSYTVTVSNSFGSVTSTAATLTVLAYNAPPVATIITPAAGLTYSAGQIINFSGSATDAEDGALPASALRWGMFFDHTDHTHDLTPTGLAVGSKTGSFTTLTGNEIDTIVSYRLVLTVTDSNGLTDTASVSVLPQLSRISFVTQPAGLMVYVNGKPQTTPFTTSGVKGITFAMGADQIQTVNGTSYQFESWVHGGTRDQTFSVPTNNTTYTAVFKVVAATTTTLTATKDAYVRDGANAATNYGATNPTKMETKLDGTANSGFNREGYLGFDLSTITGTISSAKIKVYGNLGAAGTAIPVAMYSVSSTTWAEATTNWNNKPAAGATALATTSVTDVAGKYYIWDVTNYINAEKAAGRNLVSFNFKNLANAASQLSWNTKETGTNAPQLEVITSNAQMPFFGTAMSLPGKVEVENYDFGGQNIAYNDLTTGNAGNAYRTSENVDIQAGTDGGVAIYNMGYAAAGEWMEYTVDVATEGTYSFQARVASTFAGKSFHIEMDGVNITNSIVVPNTGAWQTWATVTIPNISLSTGQKTMRIVLDTDNLNIDYINVVLTAAGQAAFSEETDIIVKENTEKGRTTTIYPNPTDGMITVGTDVAETTTVGIMIYNNNGGLVLSKSYESTKGRFEKSLDVRSLPAGTYIIQIKKGSVSESMKLVKK